MMVCWLSWKKLSKIFGKLLVNKNTSSFFHLKEIMICNMKRTTL